MIKIGNNENLSSIIRAYGACEQSGTPTPDNPVDIVCNNGALKWDGVNHRIYADGTQEVISAHGKNLLNVATNVNGYYISATGVISADATKSQYTDLIPVEVGETYTWSLISNRAVAGNDRWHGYNSNGTWVKQIDFDEAQPSGAAFSLTATIPSGIAYVRLSYGLNDTNAMFEKGASKTEYEAYSGQTASVENLFSVGDYKDEHEIIGGTVKRKCGIKVLDGTESWTTDTYGGSRRMVMQDVINASGDTLPVVCSHYAFRLADERQQPNSIFIAGTGKTVIYIASTQSITTADEFNTWLASQYANGTPVIMIYPLAQETTEQVTAQSVTEKQMAVAQASINGLEIKAMEYNDLYKRYITDDSGTPQEVVRVYIGSDLVWSKE